jgi:catechol 2,3-dioxygenase-like lactoylglutathione lyase family enzyme
MNPFHHVDLRVRKFAEVQAFYRAFLPLLGFTQEWAGKEFRGFSTEDDAPDCAHFGFTEEPNHQPNGNRIAFRADSWELVDRVGAAIRAVGARNIEGPTACPEYGDNYYAVFFEDPNGNKLEVVYRGS